MQVNNRRAAQSDEKPTSEMILLHEALNKGKKHFGCKVITNLRCHPCRRTSIISHSCLDACHSSKITHFKQTVAIFQQKAANERFILIQTNTTNPVFLKQRHLHFSSESTLLIMQKLQGMLLYYWVHLVAQHLLTLPHHRHLRLLLFHYMK